MGDEILIAVPRALAQPLHDDCEIDGSVTALFHQSLKTGEDASIDSSRV
mgnify:CR=1 FL=1